MGMSIKDSAVNENGKRLFICDASVLQGVVGVNQLQHSSDEYM